MAIRFNKEWMDKVEYKDWLLPEPSNNTKAKCRLCIRSFSLSNMGEPALKSHAQGKKHQNAVKTSGKNTSVWGFLKKDDQKASTSTQKEEPLACKESEELSAAAARSTKEKRSSSMTKLTLTREQHKAEIFRALKSVMSHFSYNSAHDITDVFKAVFPDSIIIQHMSCGPTKLSYLISFGIAPYFMDLLLKELKDAPCFVISFDECFNKELEKEQMDFIVRYFKDGQVKSRYLSSGFLGHTTAKDLKRAFEECTEKLDLKNLIQVSVDGPNVKWKMLDLIVEDRNSNETYPNLLDVGSYSLNVVHGAFRTGMKQTGWGIDLLKSLYSHLHETPARREDYTKMTGSEVFPLQFCGHRCCHAVVEQIRGKNHHVYFDNLFISVPLLNDLLEHKIYACGTVLKNKKKLPLSVKNPGKMQHGAHKTFQLGNTNLVATVWKDNREVRVLSTNSRPDVIVAANRQIGQQQVQVNQPENVAKYNKYMSGVDRHDQMHMHYDVGCLQRSHGSI